MGVIVIRKEPPMIYGDDNIHEAMEKIASLPRAVAKGGGSDYGRLLRIAKNQKKPLRQRVLAKRTAQGISEYMQAAGRPLGIRRLLP
jgi:hypothetical protein